MTTRADTASRRGCYLYGIVPADVDLDEGTQGVGDPAADVTVLRRGDIAAVVSDIDLDQPLGRSDDLLAHERLLDTIAAVAPVLPMRFGSVARNTRSIAGDLLDAHYDEFAAALREIEGHAEYVVHGRYEESVVLAEVLRENPELADLREQILGRDEDETRDARLRLGELVARAVEAKRGQDTQTVADTVAPLAARTVVREPAHEEDAVHLGLLAETARQAELERELDQLAGRWKGRIQLSLLGPLAPYDFVTPLASGT